SEVTTSCWCPGHRCPRPLTRSSRSEVRVAGLLPPAVPVLSARLNGSLSPTGQNSTKIFLPPPTAPTRRGPEDARGRQQDPGRPPGDLSGWYRTNRCVGRRLTTVAYARRPGTCQEMFGEVENS